MTEAEGFDPAPEIVGPGGGTSDTTVLRGPGELAELLGSNGLSSPRLAQALPPADIPQLDAFEVLSVARPASDRLDLGADARGDDVHAPPAVSAPRNRGRGLRPLAHLRWLTSI